MEPGLDALGMEVVCRVARQGSDLLIVLEVTLADDALLMLLEVVSVVIALDDLVYYAVPLALFGIGLSNQLPQLTVQAWEAADAKKERNSNF